MEVLKLLIADGTEEFRLALADALQYLYDLRISREGQESLNMIRSFRPDILVLDLMLPGLDGISLLQEVSRMDLHPVVLATTRFANDYVLERAAQLGVAYVMIKPCDVQATVERISDLKQRLLCMPQTAQDLRTAVSRLLMSLNVPTKLHGYLYLREALLHAMKDPKQSVTKELYPAVAEACSASAMQVERSIRSAIAAAWKCRDERIWQKYFAAGADGTVPRPTNAAFIFCLTERMLITQRKAFGKGDPENLKNI